MLPNTCLKGENRVFHLLPKIFNMSFKKREWKKKGRMRDKRNFAKVCKRNTSLN